MHRTIYSEAFDIVQKDPTVSYLLGSPMKAYGVGGNRGRRNEMERWELTEADGEEVSVVRFTVAGPQGAGMVQTQVPRGRLRTPPSGLLSAARLRRSTLGSRDRTR